MALMNMSTLRKIKKKRDEVNERGLSQVLKKYFHDHIYQRMDVIVVTRDLSLPVKKLSKQSKLDEQRVVESVEEMGSLEPHFTHKYNHFKKLFDSGAICTVGYIDNVLIGYFWISTKDFYDSIIYKHLFKLKDDEIYQLAGFIAEPYRGRAISNEGQAWVWEHFRDQGYKKVLAAVEVDNVPSLRLHFRFGFQEKGEMIHVHKLFGWRWSTSELYQGERYAVHKQRVKTKV